MSIPQIVSLVKEFGGKFGIAECFTGGLLANTIVNTSGVSAAFGGGIVAFSDDTKIRVLGVKKESLEEHGNASEVVVNEMVQGLNKSFGFSCGVAITGEIDKSKVTPFGTVFISVMIGEKIETKRFSFESADNGTEVKKMGVKAALEMFERCLKERLKK